MRHSEEADGWVISLLLEFSCPTQKLFEKSFTVGGWNFQFYWDYLPMSSLNVSSNLVWSGELPAMNSVLTSRSSSSRKRTSFCRDFLNQGPRSWSERRSGIGKRRARPSTGAFTVSDTWQLLGVWLSSRKTSVKALCCGVSSRRCLDYKTQVRDSHFMFHFLHLKEKICSHSFIPGWRVYYRMCTDETPSAPWRPASGVGATSWDGLQY